eukprot:766962-Hanusia_phi.AAC.2
MSCILYFFLTCCLLRTDYRCALEELREVRELEPGSALNMYRRRRLRVKEKAFDKVAEEFEYPSPSR